VKTTAFTRKITAFVKNVLSNAGRTLPTSLFFTALLSLTINPFSENSIGFTSFNRVFGSASFVGIDASQRISNFNIFNIAIIPLFLVISVLFCHWFTKRAEQKTEENEFSFLNAVSICGLALTVIFVFNKYNNLGRLDCFQNYGIQISLVIILATLIFIKRPFLDFKMFKFALYASFGIALFVNFLLQDPNIQSSPTSFRFGIILLICTAAVLAVLRIMNVDDLSRLKFAFVPLSFGMLFSGFALEFCNILNQHGVLIENRMLAAKLTYGLCIIVCIALYALGGRRFMRKLKEFAHWETLAIIGLLVSLSFFTAVPPLQITTGAEVFEQANAGMLVNDLLSWGKIPIVNSFDGHMLAHSLGSIAYGLFNGDILGASYFSYNFIWLLPTIVCLFLVYKNIFGKDFAFFFMIIVPALSTLSVKFGIISIIALIYALKKRTFFAYLWLLFSVVISTLYEAPTGLSYGGGVLLIAVIVLVADAVKERKITSDIKAFGKSLGVFTSVMVIAWSGLCLIQGVNPIKRALEFVGIAQSTNTWTYSIVGDTASTTFSLLYSILPIIAIACLIWLIIKFERTPSHIASAALLIAYILNFTRALGRHSLAENSVNLVMWSAILGIALFVTAVFPKRKQVAFIVIGVFVTTAVFNVAAFQNAKSIANTAITTANDPATYYDGESEKTTRVDLTVPLTTYSDVLGMIDTVIPQGETYFDLSGQTLMYALSGREKPVYINQSPLHLSGEYSQEQFISQVENFSGTCDFALLFDGAFSVGFGGGLDGVSQPYRYYKVYEYLYENYRPLCKSPDNFYLWIKKDRYDDFALEEAKEEYAEISLDTTALNDITVKLDSSLVLQSGSNDPCISFPLKEANIIPADNAIYEVKVVYKTSVSEECQMFYDFDGINEKESTKRTLTASNEYTEAYFPIPYRQETTALNAIRLDPPDNSVIEIKSISIVAVTVSGSPSDRLRQADYDYLGTLHTTKLGQIPHIWGQYDKKKSWNNKSVCEYTEASGDISDYVQEKARYTMITVESQTTGNAALSFQNANGENISVFEFTLLEGKNRYIIRSSIDWWWNSGNISKFTINTDVNINLSSVNFLVGD